MSKYNDVKTAIIGGSGVYAIEGIKIIDELDIKTPFGSPSDKIVVCDIDSRKTAFLPRHGRGHFILPTELPVKANIWALKSLGVENIISVSAVGSLKEEIAPRDFVLPDQIIDRTKQRASTFFGDSIVGHISFADPFCNDLRKIVYNVLKDNVVSV